MATQARLYSSAKAPACCACRLPPRSLRTRLSCHSDLRAGSSAAPPQRLRSASTIRSLAAAVELTSQVQRYETFAGRSAMIGVAVAAGIELITDHGVFFAVNGDMALTYAGVAVATLMAAVAVAVARGRSSAGAFDPNGVDVLESVYASLTAVRRSAASVTQAQVDKAVDHLFETVLEQRFDSFSIDGLLLSTEDDEP